MGQNSPNGGIALLAHKAGTWVERICGFICVICFASMTVVTLLGVFFRYVMQSPFMWTEEVARYLLVWLGFTAISIALWRDSHIKVDIISKIMPGIVANTVGYVIDIVVAFFMLVLLKQGYLITVNSIMKASTFNLSMKWVLVAVPVAALLTLIQLFLRVVIKTFSSGAAEDKEPQQ